MSAAADAAAKQLGIRVTAVFKAKSRILQLLRGEIAGLEPSAAGESES